MYTPQKTVISNDSAQILNTIANEIGGEFRDAVPLVKTLDDIKEYGNVVMGGGWFRNAFVAMLNKIAQTILTYRTYENQLRLFKQGILEAGDVIENIWVNLTMPEGYTQSVESPGDVFQTKNPDIKVSYHPVNYRMVYETTVNDSELSMAFQTMGGVVQLRDAIVARLRDSAELDDFIMTKATLATALLANTGATKVVGNITAATSDAFVTNVKEVSNGMQFMGTDYTVAGNPSHTPAENQVFINTAKTSAIVDVASLAKAYNLEYAKFIGRQVMINSLGFSDFEKQRLATIISESKKQGIVPGVKEFTNADYAKLEKCVGISADEKFLMIFDRLDEVREAYDSRHLNLNIFRHVWRTFSYNPFANCVFYVTSAIA